MPLVIRLPSPEEEERARRFQVHKNYIAGITLFLESEYGLAGAPLMTGLAAAQRSLDGFGRIQRRQVNEARLTQYLSLAWASELQFRLPGLGDRSLLQYSNAWAPIHAYYSIYMSAQAWFATVGAEDIVDNHTGSLNTLSNQIAQRALFPQPWSVTCSGCPHLGETHFAGLPVDAEADGQFKILANPTIDDFWPRYCKLLETTRKRRLDRNIEEWKRRRRRKNCRADEKREIAGKLLPTTLFDFFWRLRIRSNYRDVRSFLLSGVGDAWQQDFYRALEVVLEASVLLLESLVVAYSGPDAYKKALDEFVGSQRKDLPELRDPFTSRAGIVLA